MSQRRRHIPDFGKYTITEKDFEDEKDDLVLLEVLPCPVLPQKTRTRGGSESSDEDFGAILSRAKKEKKAAAAASGQQGAYVGHGTIDLTPLVPRCDAILTAGAATAGAPVAPPRPPPPSAPAPQHQQLPPARRDKADPGLVLPARSDPAALAPAPVTATGLSTSRPVLLPPPPPPVAANSRLLNNKPVLGLFGSLSRLDAGAAGVGLTLSLPPPPPSKSLFATAASRERPAWLLNNNNNGNSNNNNNAPKQLLHQGTTTSAGAVAAWADAAATASAATATTPVGGAGPGSDEARGDAGDATGGGGRYAPPPLFPTTRATAAGAADGLDDDRSPAKKLKTAAAGPADYAAAKWPEFWPDLAPAEALRNKEDIVHRVYKFEDPAPALAPAPAPPPLRFAPAPAPAPALASHHHPPRPQPSVAQRQAPPRPYDDHRLLKSQQRQQVQVQVPSYVQHGGGGVAAAALAYASVSAHTHPPPQQQQQQQQQYYHPDAPPAPYGYHYHDRSPLRYQRGSPLPEEALTRRAGDGRRLPTLAEQNFSFAPRAGGEGAAGGSGEGGPYAPTSEVHVVGPGNAAQTHTTAYAGYRAVERGSTSDLGGAYFDAANFGYGGGGGGGGSSSRASRRARRTPTQAELDSKRAAGRAHQARKKTAAYVARLRAEQPDLDEAEAAKLADEFKARYEAEQDKRVQRLGKSTRTRERVANGRVGKKGKNKLAASKKIGRPLGSKKKAAGARAGAGAGAQEESEVSEEDPDSETEESDDEGGANGANAREPQEVSVSRVAAAPDARKNVNTWAGELLNVYTVVKAYEGPPPPDDSDPHHHHHHHHHGPGQQQQQRQQPVQKQPALFSHGLAPVRVKSYLRRQDANHLAAELVHRAGTRSRAQVQRVSLTQSYTSARDDCVGGGAGGGGSGGLYRARSTFLDGSAEDVYVVRELKQAGDLGKLPYDRPWATGEARRRWDVWEVRLVDAVEAAAGETEERRGEREEDDGHGHDAQQPFRAVQQPQTAAATPQRPLRRYRQTPRRKAAADDDSLFGSDADDDESDSEVDGDGAASAPLTPATAAQFGPSSSLFNHNNNNNNNGGSGNSYYHDNGAGTLPTPSASSGDAASQDFPPARTFRPGGGTIPIPAASVDLTTPRLVGSYTDRGLANAAAAAHFLRAVKPRAPRLSETLRHERYVVPMVRERVAEVEAWEGGGGGGGAGPGGGGGLLGLELQALDYKGYDWRTVHVWVGESELRGPMN